MTRKVLITIFLAGIICFLSGCQYNLPADSKTKPHTYDEALTYIQTYLNRDDVTLSQETVSGENVYGDHYINYFAQVDDIAFIVSSQERCHYASEFCKIRYNLYNNYNYEKIHSLLENNQNYPDFELILESNPYLHIYNTTYFNYIPIITDEENLIEVFNISKMMYEWMIELYPSPRYCVKMQVGDSDRTLYLCAHQTQTDDQDYGFSQSSLEALIDEFRRFYN